MDFKIVNVKFGEDNFVVTVELLDTGERRGFGYPIGDGWEDKDGKGEHRFVKNISQRLDDMKKRKEKISHEMREEMRALKGKEYKVVLPVGPPMRLTEGDKSEGKSAKGSELPGKKAGNSDSE